jgi:X-Pro dipeptidyl-peptidase
MSPRTLLAVALAGAVLSTGAGAAAPAPPPVVKGQVFDPAPQSRPLYATQGPEEDPERQRTVVEAADGVDLYVETWLPVAKGRHVPPKRVPTILIMTPYVAQGVKRYSGERNDVIAYFTERGYAVSQGHVRGTGESGGCLEQTAASQIEDGARLVEHLGRDAPWSNGAVGMYGISYDAETQISVAGLGDKAKTKYLKAIVPAASVAGQYEYSHFDGVPYAGQALLSNTAYLGLTSATPGETSTPQQYVEKTTCQPEVMANSLNPTGDVGPFWAAREYRGGASDITAATLMVHGLADFNVQPIAVSGLFDRLPKSTPRKGLFGVWNHSFPDSHSAVAPDWARADWLPMVTAWYDRYLKGLKTGVEAWPAVQVQASDGSWRAERDFPGTGGPVGHLALGPAGTLGLPDPKGATTFTEGLAGTPVNDTITVETPALTTPLHLTGQPVLDLWVTTDRPDGHVAAQITVLGPDGEPMRHDGGNRELHATYGFRSLQHLQPIEENWFRQASPELPPTGTPLRVPVRFQPTDLVVPVGGRLQLTISGSLDHPRTSLPSGTAARITVLHDCEHMSALRFLMADPKAPALEVREVDQDGPLTAPAPKRRAVDGDLARDRVCGKAPERLDAFRPTRDLVGR